jgi:hypothetical protein
MAMSFATAGSSNNKLEKSPRCYLVSVKEGAECVFGVIKAVYPEGKWDELGPEVCYTYTRNQALLYVHRFRDLTWEECEKIVNSQMTIYSGDWHYELDVGIAAVNITAQQMEGIFVDRWNHRDLS